MFATGKGGVPLDTLEPHFLEHWQGKDSPLVSLASCGGTTYYVASWKILFSVSNQIISIYGKGISFFINFSNILIEYQMMWIQARKKKPL